MPDDDLNYLVPHNIRTVLEKAKKDAGNKDVRISGGASVIQQYLNAGLVDELTLHTAPIILGKGVGLFEKIEREKFSLAVTNVVNSPSVTHLFYKVINYNKK